MFLQSFIWPEFFLLFLIGDQNQEEDWHTCGMWPRQREAASMYKRLSSRDYSDALDMESRDYLNTDAEEEKSGNTIP